MHRRAKDDVCKIAVIYHDVVCRDLAIRLCDRLLQTFVNDLDFNVTWWGIKYLPDPKVAWQAARAAAKADLILIAVPGQEHLSGTLKAWVEHWLCYRDASEGALVLVQAKSEARIQPSRAADDYLRAIANQAKLDYLTLIGPESDAVRTGVPVGGFSPQAFQTDDRFGRRYGAPEWGINE